MKRLQLIIATVMCSFVLAFGCWGAQNPLGGLKHPTPPLSPRDHVSRGGVSGEKLSKNYEKNTTYIIRGSMLFWMLDTRSGVYRSAAGGDTPQRAHRLWRDTDLQREFDRNRLQIPLSEINSPKITNYLYRKFSKIMFISQLWWKLIFVNFWSNFEKFLSILSSRLSSPSLAELLRAK